MKKTKIVCTLGPKSENEETIKRLIENGMDCARLNASHGNHEEKLKKIDIIRNHSDSIAIMLDTKGPEIRTGTIDEVFKETGIVLHDGDKVSITSADVNCNREMISIGLKNITKNLEENQKIFIDDGLIELKVLSIEQDSALCKVINGGNLGSNKTVALPGLDITLDPITTKDKEDIEFAIKNNLDFIAVSFVKNAKDILRIKDMLEKKGSDIKIIAKIETLESTKDFDNILIASDGIMVARGDLAVDISPENVPLVQKDIITRCNNAAKPVIVATQMLESMIHNPRPTRAEVGDIANAIIDGADAVMLSGETANGKYPIKALQQIVKAAQAVEKNYDLLTDIEAEKYNHDNIAAFIAHSVYHAVDNLNLNAVIAPTSSGSTARLISRFKLKIPIIAITASLNTYRQLALTWGVNPLLGEFAAKSRQVVIDSIKRTYEEGLIKKSDTVAVTAGVPVGQAGTTNLIEIHRVEQFLAHNHFTTP